MTMEFRTMSHRSSVLTKSLDRTLEALTFADCSSVDSVASCEDVSFDFLCQCVLRRIFKPEFSYISLAGNTSFFEVSLLSFIYAMSVNDFLLASLVSVDNFFFLINETNLNCFVTIIFYGLDLCYDTGTSLKYGYRDQHAVFVEDLSHSDFGS